MANIFRRIASAVRGLFESRGPRIYTKMGKTAWTESGQWAVGQSSYVYGIRFDQSKKELYVRFHKGAVCKYPNIPTHLAQQMFHASSLGRFTRAYLFSRAYQLVD